MLMVMVMLGRPLLARVFLRIAAMARPKASIAAAHALSAHFHPLPVVACRTRLYREPTPARPRGLSAPSCSD